MSRITRGVAVILLAGAVAAAGAFPRFLAGPGGTQTPALAPLPAETLPTLVRAAPLLSPPAAVLPRLFHAVPTFHVASQQAVQAVAKPAAVERIAPPAAPAPAPTPAPAPAHAALPAQHRPAPAPSVTVIAAPAVRVPASVSPTPPAPAPALGTNGHGDNGLGHGKGNGKGKSSAPVESSTGQPQQPPASPGDQSQPQLGSSDGSTQQAPPGSDRSGGGDGGHLEASDPGTASSDHGHGPPPWANGHHKGH
jgi:hypothetical protein